MPHIPYCRAYRAAQLRSFPGWKTAAGDTLADDDLCYLHDTFRVTRSILPDRDVIFESDAESWRLFCSRALEFSVPEDLLLSAKA